MTDRPVQHLVVYFSAGGAGHGRLVFKGRTGQPDDSCADLGRGPAIEDWQVIRSKIEDLRKAIDDLIGQALQGSALKAKRFEDARLELGRWALPEEGFVRLAPPGARVQIDAEEDFASEIPWEVLAESYRECRLCGRIVLDRYGTSDYCEHGTAHLVSQGGDLALSHDLAHAVHTTTRPEGGGKTFLMIEDPLGDLCQPTADATGKCAQHLPLLFEILRSKGYEVSRIIRDDATSQNVLRALANPDVVGIYYFGHGYSPPQGGRGCLVLKDRKLWANEIEALAPRARFVFLNACQAGAPDYVWGVDRKSGSVAAAFARGRGTTVIAPYWPIVNGQAAASALEFFRSASPTEPVAVALRHLRSESHKEFRADKPQPHLSWMAYRLLGDPNLGLPRPVEAPAISRPAGPGGPACRLYDERGYLRTELFGFSIDAVLMRAAKRRNHQNRRHIEFLDLMAGLVRKGALTRSLLRRARLNPDRVYEELAAFVEADRSAGAPARSAAAGEPSGSGPEPGDASGGGKATLRSLLTKWVVREQSQFAVAATRLLTCADGRAQARAGAEHNARISERDLVECALVDPAWKDGAPRGLPAPDTMRHLLAQVEREGALDANGELTLEALDPAARAIVRTVHDLAQQRGVTPITHRLMLAGLLANPTGFAARVCRLQVSPELLRRLMMALTEHKGEREFALDEEACERAVLPALRQARGMAREAAGVSERDLFRAFCAVATPPFKASLRESSLQVDLDVLQQAEPPPPLEERLEESALAWLELAAGWARVQGSREIRSAHLFAAMIGDCTGPVATALARQAPLEMLKIEALEQVKLERRAEGETRCVAAGANVEAVLGRAIRRAQAAGRTRAGAEDLFREFFAASGGSIGSVLARHGIQVPPEVGWPG